MSPSRAAHPPPPQSTAARWAPGPLQPVLAGGEVHVWHVELDGVSEELLRALSAGERARAERIVRDPERRLWCRSRGVLRALLGGYLRSDPAALEIVLEQTGKPTVLQPHAKRPPLHFSLSHSGPIALYAFTEAGPVGVDVELAREPRTNGGPDYVALSRRAFGAGAARRQEALDRSLQEREFLREWTLHEARVKCTGTGLGASRATSRSVWAAELALHSAPAAALALWDAPAAISRWLWQKP